jgi:ceramide glucosyltransferase
LVLATTILLILLAGSAAYALLTIPAARSYLRAAPPALTRVIPISVLKPLAGVDEGLEENLRSFFTQQYGEFEILLAVRHADDPAVAIVEKLKLEYPAVQAQLVVTGLPPYPNAKVFKLETMVKLARHDILVMSDSDIRVSQRLLETVAREFQDGSVGLVTCPYRAVAGASIWSQLEAIGLNTEFLGGVLTQRFLNGMDFALGPTLAIRRQVLEKIRGFDHLRDYLAEDFVLGKRVAASGASVVLSCERIEHRIGSQRIWPNLVHRLRWARSTRRSRPAGYVGQVFTHSLPLALAACVLHPHWWALAVFALAARAASAAAVAGWVLHDSATGRRWWMIPIQDLLSVLVWIAGFFGSTIHWRGQTYSLLPDGRFELKQ